MSAALGATLTDEEWHFVRRALRDWIAAGFVPRDSPLAERAEAIEMTILQHYPEHSKVAP